MSDKSPAEQFAEWFTANTTTADAENTGDSDAPLTAREHFARIVQGQPSEQT